MFGRYRAVFRAPGSVAFCAASFVMRLPIAIYPIGIVLIISARDGRYGFAGVLSAIYVIAEGISAPLLSVVIDRLGQHRVIPPATAVHTLGVVALALLLHTDAPDWALAISAVVLGMGYLTVGSLVRARWSHAWSGRPELDTALSVESVLDELIFVTGPLIATVIATQVDPDIVLYLALALVVVGSVWLTALRSTEPPPHPRQAGTASALRSRGMVVLTLATVPIGGVFASAEVSAVAYCGQHGARGLSGVALAAIAAGSAVSGLVYGARTRTAGMLVRFRRQVALFAVLPLVLLAVVDVPVLVAADFVLGLGIAPALITMFGLVQQVVPTGSLTEGLSWTNTGLSLGYGAGASLVGGIADRFGAQSAFLVTIGAALLAGLLGAMVYARLRPVSGSEHADVPRWDDAALP